MVQSDRAGWTRSGFGLRANAFSRHGASPHQSGSAQRILDDLPDAAASNRLGVPSGAWPSSRRGPCRIPPPTALPVPSWAQVLAQAALPTRIWGPRRTWPKRQRWPPPSPPRRDGPAAAHPPGRRRYSSGLQPKLLTPPRTRRMAASRLSGGYPANRVGQKSPFAMTPGSIISQTTGGLSPAGPS